MSVSRDDLRQRPDPIASGRDAHADGIKKFTPAFETLYVSMSDAQKKDADALFRHGGKMSKKSK